MDATAIHKAAEPPSAASRTPMWIGLFVLCTLIAVLLTSYRYLDDLTRQHPGTPTMRVLD